MSPETTWGLAGLHRLCWSWPAHLIPNRRGTERACFPTSIPTSSGKELCCPAAQLVSSDQVGPERKKAPFFLYSVWSTRTGPRNKGWRVHRHFIAPSWLQSGSSSSLFSCSLHLCLPVDDQEKLSPSLPLSEDNLDSRWFGGRIESSERETTEVENFQKLLLKRSKE